MKGGHCREYVTRVLPAYRALWGIAKATAVDHGPGFLNDILRLCRCRAWAFRLRSWGRIRASARIDPSSNPQRRSADKCF